MPRMRALDYFIHTTMKNPPICDSALFRSEHQRLQRLARNCRRFVFGPEASTRLGEVVRNIPDMLFDNQEFARAPFDRCSIEVDVRCFIDALGNQPPADEDSDWSLTYIIDHDRVNVLAAGRTSATLCPFEYFLHQQMEVDYLRGRIVELKIHPHTIAEFLWGSSLGNGILFGQPELLWRHSFDIMPSYRAGDPANVYAFYGPRAQGELRNLIAALLLLNRPSLAKFTEVPAGRTFQRGKSVQYLSHTNVSISVDAVPQLRRVHQTGERGSTRRHEVRGHWKHNREFHDWTDAGCIHEWRHTPTKTNDRHYTCDVCDSHRWWTTAFTRGDATKGFVVHDGYDVGQPEAETA